MRSDTIDIPFRTIGSRKLAAMRLPRFAELGKKRKKVPSSHREKILPQREPIIAYGIVPVATKCRGVRVGDAISPGHKGGAERTKKLTAGWMGRGMERESNQEGKKGGERDIYISERLKALEFLYGEVRGAICGTLRMFHYWEAFTAQLPNFE